MREERKFNNSSWVISEELHTAIKELTGVSLLAVTCELGYSLVDGDFTAEQWLQIDTLF